MGVPIAAVLDMKYTPTYTCIMKKKGQPDSREVKAIRSIRNSIAHRGRTPSVRELMVALGYKSPRSAQLILRRLEEMGIILRTEPRGYQLLTDPTLGPTHEKTVNVPLVGSVACGMPILAQENVEAYFPVSTALARPGSRYYFLRAVGDSMNEAGIVSDDFVLVRQQQTASDGDKVVALIDEEATIKEYHRDKGFVILKPRSKNKTHKPIILSDDFQIQGVVVGTLRNLE